MMQDEADRAKAALRKRMREALGALPPVERQAQSMAACQRILALTAFRQAKTLLAYMPLSYECDPGPAVEAARQMGKAVAFPVYRGAEAMGLFIPADIKDLKRGSLGIWEPIPQRCREVGPEGLDLIILPGLAFDGRCNRLGHGKGCYDKLLPHTGAFCLGLALPLQMVPTVPTGPLDAPLHGVVTGEGLWLR